MTREELKEHCKKQIELCEFWAVGKGEKPSGKVYEEHKLILELLEQEPNKSEISTGSTTKNDLGVENDLVSSIVEKISEKATETSEEFIFETIRPYCENVVQMKISKRDLEQALLKYYGKNDAPQEPRWISVSEKYPKIEDEYKYFLVTDDKGKVSVQEFLMSLDEEPQPYFSGMVNVIAWMPLPEPYKPQESEEA